ncbi:hypothetical protein [Bdellovibrio bacteriovorus]|nr:hypothetical protein [Bdellovibrio bacteriovorus]
MEVIFEQEQHRINALFYRHGGGEKNELLFTSTVEVMWFGETVLIIEGLI